VGADKDCAAEDLTDYTTKEDLQKLLSKHALPNKNH